MKEKKSNSKSGELLNKYMNSGGKDATYDDVVNAVRKEKLKESVNLWKKILSLESVILYLKYIFLGSSVVKPMEWTVILPDESKVSAVKEKELLTPMQINILSVFRGIFVVFNFLMKALAYVIGSILAVAIVLFVYLFGIAYPISIMIGSN